MIREGIQKVADVIDGNVKMAKKMNGLLPLFLVEILLKAQRRPTTFDDKALLYICSICCTIKKEFQLNVLGGNVDATPKATKCVSTITFRVVCFFIA